MRTSKARVTGRSDAALHKTVDGGAALGDLAARGARYVTAVLAVLLLAAVTLVATPSSPARADTTFASGQVFASVGFSTVNIYDGSSGTQLSSLVDSTPQLDVNGFPTFTTGTVFDANNDLLVTDDSNNSISEFSSSGAPMGQYATGLTNPESLVFDSSGNLYVGQQSTPYIAEFSPTGQRLPDIGPLNTDLFGDDWIDLAADECTFYYTSEGTHIDRYNKCTNTQLPPLNTTPLGGLGAFQLKILANGDVLVADSSSVLLLDPNGNVLQTYSCSSLPGCQGLLFAVSVDPNGTSFWTGDAQSGDVWQIDIATGNVLKSFPTGSPGILFGLTVDGQLMAATVPTITAQTVTNLSPPTVSGSFSFDTPTPVTSVLTDSSGNPVSGEQVTFTLNGDSAESCTSAPTGSDGVATCDITPTEPAQSYTLTASFSGDTTSSTPLAQSGSSSSITVTPDTTTLDYTGPTTAVNGQPVTLTGTLTTDNPSPGTPLNGQVVDISLGTQSCSGTTLPDGTVSCTISTVDQPVSDVTITASYGGSDFQSSASLPTPVPAIVMEPTTLTVHTATGDFGDATTISGTLTDSVSTAPVPGEQLTLSLNGTDTCTTPETDATGTASCTITPSEAEGTYALTGSFTGDTSRPLQLMPSNGSSNFVVTLEETTLTYTGPTIAQNGQSLTLSGVLTTESATPDTDGDSGLGAPIVGRTVAFQLGTGASAQTCSGATDTNGAVSCTISSVTQPPGPIPVTDTFAGDSYYQTATAASTVNLPEGTELTVNPTSGVYNGSTPVSATLINTYTNEPVPNESVTFTVTGAPPCTATTDAQGVATCNVTPTEPAGTYTLSVSFPGDNATTPQLLPTDSSTTFTETQAPTTVTYTGPTTLTNGQPVTLSGVVTSSEPTPGTPVGGESVTFTVGSQSCTGTSAPDGDVSCTISDVNQSSGTVTVTTSVSGNDYYQPTSTSTPATTQSPTTLTVSATTGPYGGPTTVTGTLTNSVTGQPVAGQTVTLTLNGTESCTAVTGTDGKASCSITPSEPAGSYTVSGSYGGNPSTSSGPALLPTSGSNTFVVTKAPTTIVNTSPTIAVNGMPITLSATVTTTGGSGPGGLPVTLTLGSGSTAQSCTGIAAPNGQVSCTITNPNQVSGTTLVTVTFGGNSYYQSSSNSTSETTASLPSTGDFIVGNLTADGTATGSPINGTTVNFWGSQYWKNNSFSGVLNPPASMKGYIDSAPQLTCPSPSWTSDPGNSSNPPSTVPVNMVVIVGSTITQSGSTELGDIKHLAIVHVQPGYADNPGHDGWGQIIANIC